MINLSKAFRRELFYDRRNYLVYADITLADKTVLKLTNTQIWTGGFAIEDAVSEDDSFTALGSTIVGAATLVINNMDEKYSGYDFTNATAVLYVAMSLTENGSTREEKIRKGTYTVDDTRYNGGTITLTLLDNMAQFDRPYSTTLSYPATLDQIVRDACTKCGVTLNTYDFPHKTFTVQNAPSGESTTYREVIGWAAAIAGCFARCDREGRLELKWFDQATLEGWNEGDVNGGTFDSGSPYYTSGDNVSGGSFDSGSPYYTSGDNVDGGTFQDEKYIHHIYSLNSQDICIDDVVITGVAITVKDESEESTSATLTYTSGSAGYVIAIEDNEFLTKDTAQEVANWLGTQLNGLTFRKASVTHLNNPSIEAGDIGIIFDRKNREYPILVTRTNFSVDGPQTTVCGAETPSRNSATRYGWQTKAYVESRKLLKAEQSLRTQMMRDLNEKLDEKSGLYCTVETATSGNVFYLHDMPELADSSIVWKMTRDAWGVTTDYKGSETVWNAGMTVDGDMIARIMSVIGIDFDWGTGGTLTLGGADNGNGELRLLNSAGGEVARLNNTGFEFFQTFADLFVTFRTKLNSGALNFTATNQRTGYSYTVCDITPYVINGSNNSQTYYIAFDCPEAGFLFRKKTWNSRTGKYDYTNLLEILDDSVKIHKPVTVNSTQTVNGSQTVTGDQTVNSTQTVNGSQTVTGDQTVTGNQAVNGNGTFSGQVTANGGITSTGGLSVSGGLAGFANGAQITGGRLHISGWEDVQVAGRGLEAYSLTALYNIHTNWSVYAANISNSSDRRLKKNIQKTETNIIDDLEVVSFDWKRNNAHVSAGFIAQDVEKICPELVTFDANGMLSLNYIGIIPHLVHKVQEQDRQIKAMDERIKKLEKLIYSSGIGEVC